MKKILYTVCSANHLAHCKTMTDSFAAFHPDYSIIIGLVDKVDNRFAIEQFKPYEIWEIGNMQIPDFEAIIGRYSVIELNCAMKAFVAQAIFARDYPDILLYLDSDMWVHHPLTVVESLLLQHSILITPHFTQPLPDNLYLPLERDLLRSGVYNAGFMAMTRSATTDKFLHWWSGHMKEECYYKFSEGMGVDQIWLNLVPMLFPEAGVFHHPGANVAYWNVHERHLTENGQMIMVNDAYPLLFLHISGYNFDKPELLSRHQTRFQLAALPVWKWMFSQYQQLVISNGYEKYHTLPCLYATAPTKSLGIMKKINQLLKPMGIKISKHSDD